MKIPNYLHKIQNVMIFNHEAIIQVPGLLINRQHDILDIQFNPNFASELTLVFLSETENNIALSFASAVRASVSIVHLYSKSSNKRFEYSLGSNSTVSIKEIYLSSRMVKPSIYKSYHFASDSLLTLSTGMLMDGLVKIEEDFNLDYERAELHYDSLSIGHSHDELISKQSIRHLAKNTISNIQNLLVSSDASKLDFEVKGYIAKGMSGSICKQQNRGVILNEFGSIRVDPKLFIDEFDVDAGHGAAIGQINEDEMFYLLSRGLDESSAKRLIVSGYTDPLISMFEAGVWQNVLRRKIARKVKGEEA